MVGALGAAGAVSAVGPLAMLLVALGGGLGSVLRYALDVWVTRAAGKRSGGSTRAAFPWGITLVNLSGSLLLGLLVGILGGLLSGGALDGWLGGPHSEAPAAPLTAAPGALVAPGAAASPLWLALGVGLLGGYTTLSTASLDTVRLARAGRFWASAVNALGTLGIAVLLAIAGILLGQAAAPLLIG